MAETFKIKGDTMMQHEFEKLIGHDIESEKYLIIEDVYMNYPGDFSKEICATMYKTFGMVIFNDMLPRADKISKLESEIRARQLEIQALQGK